MAKALVIVDRGVVMPEAPPPVLVDCDDLTPCFPSGWVLETTLIGAEQNGWVVNLLKWQCSDAGCVATECDMTFEGVPDTNCATFLLTGVKCNPNPPDDDPPRWEMAILVPFPTFVAAYTKGFGQCPDGAYAPDPANPGISGTLTGAYI